VTLTNLKSDRISKIRGLARAAVRQRLGLVLVEGPQACREAAVLGLVQDLYCTDDAAERHPLTVQLVTEHGGHVHLASEAYVSAISPAAQQILAVARLEAPIWPQDWSMAAVFDQIRDPGNAGTVIRSACAMGLDAVLFTAGSVDPSSPKVIRSSAGAVFHLPVLAGAVVGTLEQAVARLRQTGPSGVQVLATGPAGTVRLGALPEARLAKPTVWLFGNEAQGLGELELALANEVVAVEMYGPTESLNLAVAAGIVFHAAALAANRSGQAPTE